MCVCVRQQGKHAATVQMLNATAGEQAAGKGKVRGPAARLDGSLKCTLAND